MKVKFVGATNGITGSCTWLKHLESNNQWLVDCGLNQGQGATFKNQIPFPFNPACITDVLLTHAHIDHCGLIPKLYKEGFTGRVYCTEATAEISKIQLKSAVKHMDGNLYDVEHVDAIQWHTFDTDERFAWGNPVGIAKDVSLTPTRGSHMLGACGMQLAWKTSATKWTCMFFTGDVGNNTGDHTQFPMLKGNHAAFPSADYIMVESTYGARVREDQYRSMDARHQKLWAIINKTLNERDGKVIIPAFAAQRAQDITLDIVLGLCSGNLKKRAGRPVKVLLHSPSIAKLNKIYADQLEKKFWGGKGEKDQYLNEELRRILKPNEIEKFIGLLSSELNKSRQLTSFGDFGEGKIVVSSDPGINTNEYDVIIASSGMAEGGYIVNHLDAYENDSRNSVLITGYQSPNTRGGKINKEPESIEAEVFSMSPYYSGHADQKTLLDLKDYHSTLL